MRLAGLLRLTAVGIALLALLDPPLVVAPQPPLRVSVAVAESRFGATPAAAGPETRAEIAQRVVTQLRQALAEDTDVRVTAFGDGDRVPCGQHEACVVVTDRARDVALPADRRGSTSVVAIGDTLAPNLQVQSVQTFPTHVAAEGLLSITLAGQGLVGKASAITVSDAGAIVAQTLHTFTSDEPVTVATRWWPVAAGVRVLHVDAAPFDGERTSVDNGVDVAVDVQQGRMPVLVYEPRPSFASAFVRRALESDARFSVDARTRLGATLAAGTAGARLDGAALDRYAVVVVGAPEALTAAEVTRLDTFVQQRGGTLVLVPDRSMAGPVARLLALPWTERLETAAVAVGALHATELLITKSTGVGDDVLASSRFGAAVVATSRGLGRVVVSGALDAWRYRLDGSNFDHFWRGLVADAAAVSGPPTSVEVRPALVTGGGTVAVTVQARSMTPSSQRTAAAVWQCGTAEPRPLRLWPGPAVGTFVATIQTEAGVGPCVVTVSVAGQNEAQGRFAVMREKRMAVAGSQPHLERAVAASGGLLTTPDSLAPLTAHLLGLRSANRQPEEVRPLRSPWWLVPLSLCLAGEWWLRRRGGLR